MEAHRHQAADRRGSVGEEGEAGEQPVGRGEGAGGGELHAAGQLAQLDAGHLERGALAGRRLLAQLAVHLDAAHPHRPARRQQLEGVAGAHLAARQGAGDHRPQPLEVEGAVDRQASGPVGVGGHRPGFGEAGQGRLQLLDALAGAAGDGEDRGAGERGGGEQLFDFEVGQLEEVGGDQVGLGQRHHPGGDPQQRADRQVLAGLRLDPLVGGDHQQHHPDAAEAGQGVVEEALVAGDVDEADPVVAGGEVGEAEVDGDPAPLLLAPAVAVDAGQRLDQRGLAVVDVAGGADDQVGADPTTPRGSRGRGG